MAAYSFRRMNPVIPTTGVVSYNDTSLLLETDPFTSELATPKFVLQINQAIPYGLTYPAIMGLDTLTQDYIFLYDRLGYYVRADRLYRAMAMRKSGCIYGDCHINEFQCVVRFDPLRVYVLDNLPQSVYVPTVTTTTIKTTASQANTVAKTAQSIALIN